MRRSLEPLKIFNRPSVSKPAGGIGVVDVPSSPPDQSLGLSTGSIGANPAMTPAPASQPRKERRRRTRTGLKLSARVRPADLRQGDRYEVFDTVNATRQSLYFITTREIYRVGMRLRVTFPFNSAHDSAAASEVDGEVVRTEYLPDNRIGVAVDLQVTAHTARSSPPKSKPSASGGSVAERRIVPRRPFSADAEAVDTHASIRLQARCSDLSLEGCYVDTINPFPNGTLLHIKLQTGDRVFEANARVNSSHLGMGMGLCFQRLTADQKSVLAQWLNNNEPAEPARVTAPPEVPKQNESTDRTEAINLVRHMLAKGILTKADLADIFF